MKTPFTGPLRPLKYGENCVKFVSVTKCLGIEIDHKLSWNAQIGKVRKSYSKKIGALERMKLPKKALEEIYYKTIVSGVTYGISVWGNCSVHLFQRPEAIHATQGGNSLTFMTGVIMSGHFLRPPNMLTKFSETPKNYVDQFFSKIAFYWQ